MATSIQVNKKSVEEMLTSGAKREFVIPEYQRPYAWSTDEINTLWEDLVNFANQRSEKTYFLGAIVFYENENGEQEIIDGQQRLTSLFLMLRAIYSKLESMKKDKQVIGLQTQLGKTIWETDPITQEPNKKKVLISSLVLNESSNETLKSILISGKSDSSEKDNYSNNFNTFCQLIDGYAKEEPFQFYELIVHILKDAILLPIEADTQDTALTIFSTLNDRGMPLNDADIFKAKIYNSLSADLRAPFISMWQDVSERSEAAGINVQALFAYYAFTLRAEDNDKDTSRPALRKYFGRNNWEKLRQSRTMSDIEREMDIWETINTRNIAECPTWYKNNEVQQLLDILTSYPNEYWKYTINTYLLIKGNDKPEFTKEFVVFLKKFISVLVSGYLIKPTVNAVKQPIMNLNASIFSNSLNFSGFKSSLEEAIENVIEPPAKLIPMLLKIIAYDDSKQRTLLPFRLDVEHILPRKWQTTSLYGYSFDQVQPYIEHLGNKVPFEKRLNIQAGNKYFEQKKGRYSVSKVEIVKQLSQYQGSEWGISNITERDDKLKKMLKMKLSFWNKGL